MDITEGARVVVVAVREAEKVVVSIQAPPKCLLNVERLDGDKWKSVTTVPTNLSGAAPALNLTPGTYRVRVEGAAGEARFDVAPGAPEVKVTVAGK